MAEVEKDAQEGKQGGDHAGFEKKLNEQDKIMKDVNAEAAAEKEDSDILDEEGNFDERVFKFKNWKSYKHNQQSLECPSLENNPLFRKLQQRLIKHLVIAEKVRINGLTLKQQEEQRCTGVQFNYLTKLHKSLYCMLREVIITDDKQNQQYYLKRTYEWFIKQQRAVGLITAAQDEKEGDFLNPQQVKAKEDAHAQLIEQKRCEFMDDEKHDRYMRDMFDEKERNEIPSVLPAKDRIKLYKTKVIKRSIPSALPKAGRNPLGTSKSQADFKIMPSSAKDAGARPITAGLVSQFGNSEAPTAVSNNVMYGNFTASNARAISHQRFSRFEECEKSVQSHAFGNFYSGGLNTDMKLDPSQFHKENRFEGKSSYMNYYPTGQTFEQELEQYWFDQKNKELADKRRDEERMETMKEWGQARGRMEAEIARKKEHLNVATNFELARGWTRSNWKTKNYKVDVDEDEFLKLSESSDDDKLGGEPESAAKLSNQSPSPQLRGGLRSGSKLHGGSGLNSGRLKSGPQVIDVTQDLQSYGMRPSTAVMCMQLEAIQEQNLVNSKLKGKKKPEALPEISAPNIYAKTLQERDPKKGEIKYTKKYYNIGFVDGSQKQRGGLMHNPELPRGSSAFTLNNKTKALQQISSKSRISSLRKHMGGLIGAQDNKEEEIQNPFQAQPTHGLQKSSQTASALSLSVYNRPAQLARPKTAQVNVLHGIKGLEPIEVNEEGIAIEVVKDTRIADMQLPLDRPTDHFRRPAQMLARTGQDQSRLQNMVEMQQIKQTLAKEGCLINMGVLERAVMVPEDCEWLPGDRQYPTPGAGLMINPFPKVKKKKKGKKGKKK